MSTYLFVYEIHIVRTKCLPKIGKKNKTLKGEIENHEPRINTVHSNGLKLLDQNHPESDEFERYVYLFED